MLRFALVEALAGLAERVGQEQELREAAYLWANRLAAAARAGGGFLFAFEHRCRRRWSGCLSHTDAEERKLLYVWLHIESFEACYREPYPLRIFPPLFFLASL